MTQKAKNLFVYGTRPELIKLYPVIKHTKDKYVVCTGQHRELLDKTLIEPDIELDTMKHGKRLLTTVDAVLCHMSWIIEFVQPDRVIVQGDTATAFATALVAFHQGVELAHVEAGLRTYDRQEPWPEEVYRQFITSTATTHFAPTKHAAAQLKRIPIYAPSVIHITGNPVVDAVRELAPKATITSNVLVTLHRRNAPVGMYSAGIVKLAKEFPDKTFRVVIHPNPTGQALKGFLRDKPGIELVEPMGYLDFLKELARCFLVMTDSGGLQEEAPTLHKPVIVLRQRTERPEGVGKGAFLAKDAKELMEIARRLFTGPMFYINAATAKNPFGDGHAGEKIAAVLNNA
jgi:UDP-N-acetylglucosamine 2-epimerase (non-hydrolysing)